MNTDIILTGLMGAGKSTVGKLLADKLPEYAFFDVDEEIEKREKMTIADIFKLKSEKMFRLIETDMIAELSKKNNVVISIGGGAFENEANRKNLLNCGTVFYLKTSADILYKRIQKQGNRPLLNCADPADKLSELLKQREINYNKAHYIIDTSNKSIDDTVEEILRKIKWKKPL